MALRGLGSKRMTNLVDTPLKDPQLKVEPRVGELVTGKIGVSDHDGGTSSPCGDGLLEHREGTVIGRRSKIHAPTLADGYVFRLDQYQRRGHLLSDF
jgi:hypothetical protein